MLPVEVGDSLPVLRMTELDGDPDALANRALASACVLTNEAVSATPALLAWAEAVLDGEPPSDLGPPFSEPLILHGWSGPTIARSMEVRRPADPNLVQPDPELSDEDIGRADAILIAEIMVGVLVERGLLPRADLRLMHVSTVETGVCTRDGCTNRVLLRALSYAPFIAGASLVGSGVRLDIDRYGRLDGLRFEGIEVERVGMAIAALDEAEAERRFLKLAQAESTLEVSLPTPGRVAYLVPLHEQPLVVEPVWFGEWVATSDGPVAGRPQLASLSLSDPEAPLVPHHL